MLCHRDHRPWVSVTRDELGCTRAARCLLPASTHACHAVSKNLSPLLLEPHTSNSRQLQQTQAVRQWQTCLTATSWPVSLLRPRYTLPNAPAPIISPSCQLIFSPALKRSTLLEATAGALAVGPVGSAAKQSKPHLKLILRLHAMVDHKQACNIAFHVVWYI